MESNKTPSRRPGETPPSFALNHVVSMSSTTTNTLLDLSGGKPGNKQI